MVVRGGEAAANRRRSRRHPFSTHSLPHALSSRPAWASRTFTRGTPSSEPRPARSRSRRPCWASSRFGRPACCAACPTRGMCRSKRRIGWREQRRSPPLSPPLLSASATLRSPAPGSRPLGGWRWWFWRSLAQAWAGSRSGARWKRVLSARRSRSACWARPTKSCDDVISLVMRVSCGARRPVRRLQQGGRNAAACAAAAAVCTTLRSPRMLAAPPGPTPALGTPLGRAREDAASARRAAAASRAAVLTVAAAELAALPDGRVRSSGCGDRGGRRGRAAVRGAAPAVAAGARSAAPGGASRKRASGGVGRAGRRPRRVRPHPLFPTPLPPPSLQTVFAAPFPGAALEPCSKASALARVTGEEWGRVSAGGGDESVWGE